MLRTASASSIRSSTRPRIRALVRPATQVLLFMFRITVTARSKGFMPSTVPRFPIITALQLLMAARLNAAALSGARKR